MSYRAAVLWSAPICLVVHQQRVLFYFCKDMNTERDQFWQFSVAQFSVEVCDRETKVLIGSQDNRCYRRAYGLDLDCIYEHLLK